jgi:transcriptional regulator with XRE-family HTH domain
VQYCAEHNNARRANQRAIYHSKNVKKEEKTNTAITKKTDKEIAEKTNTEITAMTNTEINKVPSSMSMLCAISADGFFLDVFPKSHKKSYFKDKGSEDNPIHFSASERIHVPQTYMLLLHKFLFHCGSAVPDNRNDQTGQQRLFAYVTTEFLENINQDEEEYKNLISKNRTSDIPDAKNVFRKPYQFCCKQNSINWLCDRCDKDKVMSREKQTNRQITTEWDKTVPGTVVAGNMKKLGYVIVRTSLTKQECPYLLAMESSMTGWENISSKGKQKCLANCKREQFALDNSRLKGIKNVFALPFSKLRTDIVKMDRSMSKQGYWTQVFEHRKMLRNMGPCPKQYPHADYKFLSVRFGTREDANQEGDASERASKKSKTTNT